MMRGSIVIKERPILFSAPMIRALLAGTKTQTRRIVNPQPELDLVWDSGYHWPSKLCQSMVTIDEMRSLGPYGRHGDRLWCRETWASADPGQQIVAYRANGQSGAWFHDGERRFFLHHGWVLGAAANDQEGKWFGLGKYGGKWRPSIFMPRWASRLTLEIATIRVERLQDISEDDARAEGVRPFFEVYDCFGPDQRICTGELARDFPYRASYACLWDEINGDRALWNTNPWVWVIAFKKLAATET